MEKRKVFFICTDDNRYCSELEFHSHNRPDAKRWGIWGETEPNGIYLARHEQTNNSPFMVEMLLMKKEKPELERPSINRFYNSGWVRHRSVLHGVLADFVNQSKSKEIMEALVNHQLPYVHNDKLPNKGTWGYAVKSARTFKPQQIAQMRRLLLKPDGKLRPEYHVQLCNPRIEDFVICASGAASYPQMKLRAWQRAKGIFYQFGYEPRIHIWDSVELSWQLTLYPHVLIELARFWANQITTLGGGNNDE